MLIYEYVKEENMENKTERLVILLTPTEKKQLLENKFSKKTESRKQLYAVIRQADGNGFKSSSVGSTPPFSSTRSFRPCLRP